MGIEIRPLLAELGRFPARRRRDSCRAAQRVYRRRKAGQCGDGDVLGRNSGSYLVGIVQTVLQVPFLPLFALELGVLILKSLRSTCCSRTRFRSGVCRRLPLQDRHRIADGGLAALGALSHKQADQIRGSC